LRPHQPLILVQSSTSQTCLPVLYSLIQPAKHRPNTSSDSLKVFDYTGRIPGYDETHDSRDEILAAVRSAPPGSLHVIVDSVDTLATDLASNSQTYKFIRSLLNIITSRSRVLYPY